MAQQKYFQMNKQVTFGHILTILIMIIFPLLLWGINLEIRNEKQTTDILNNKEDIKDIEKDTKVMLEIIQINHNETMSGLHSIELKLKDKQNRLN